VGRRCRKPSSGAESSEGSPCCPWCRSSEGCPCLLCLSGQGLSGGDFGRRVAFLPSLQQFHAMVASSSSIMHDRNVARKNAMTRKNVVHAPRKVVNEPSTIYYACNASFAICRKGKKIIAKKVGAKCKGDKTCIWIPKTIVTNLVGPNESWVPKTQA
jgi:hypothetical protein